VTILQAIRDKHLFRPFLGDNLDSWQPWATALRALYGLGVKSPAGKALVQQCTGRSCDELPTGGFSSALFLVGRRSGKSRVSAVIAAFEALLGGHEQRLAPGETGIVPIISPSKFQSTIVWNYLSAIFDAPVLANELKAKRELEKIFTLKNGIEIRILTGDFRVVRGFSVVCCVLDELCFFGLSEESKIKSDTELVRALRPALITTGGKLIGISTKYAQRGYAYQTWKRQHGSNKGDSQFAPDWRILVWDCPSRVMNSTLRQSEIDAAFAEDPASARAEFLGQWREDVAEFVPRSLIESLVIPGRKELLVSNRNPYRAGCDLSGGRKDSAALVICHKEGQKVIEDFAREFKAPFNPFQIVDQIAVELRRWGLTGVTGDAYAGDWPVEAFKQKGIRYRPAECSKNEAYRELLPVLCGGRDSIELLDNLTQTNQLASLERKTRSGGADVIDHPANGHDDLANALAIAVSSAAKRTVRAGGIRSMLADERSLALNHQSPY
jgi:hypothetical protein